MMKKYLTRRSSIYFFMFMLMLPPLAPNGRAQQAEANSDTAQVPFITPIADPLESLNRGTSVFNHGVMMGIINPLGYGYRFIFRKPVRESIDRIGTNLAYPVRLFNNLFQAKFRGAGRETGRFLINSTVGLAGIFDPASHWGIEPSREDFGQTLGKWGWTESDYLVLPMAGPKSNRDTVGYLMDAALNPATYLFGASSFFSFNRLSDFILPYRKVVATEYDPYALARMAYGYERQGAVADYEYTPAKGGAIETLQVLFLKSRDPNFIFKGDTHKVYIAATGKKLPYTCWMQKKSAPVIYILPGLGSHRLASSAVALAEMVYENGYSAVTISNAMNWEFMEKGSTSSLAGFVPDDARDVHGALDAVRHDFWGRYGDRVQEEVLMGMSLGGLHTLFIAASDDGRLHTLEGFDRYVAINAPISLLHGMIQLDDYYNAPLAWPESERRRRMENTLMKVAEMAQGDLTPETELPFSEVEAKYLIGLKFRLDLRDVIYNSQSRENMGVLEADLTSVNRGEAYAEIMNYSYMEYLRDFVVPYYSAHHDPPIAIEELFRRSDLRSLQDSLANSDKIYFFLNSNDFIMTPEQVYWVRTMFGPDKVTLFENGGHLGNLYRPEVQKKILDVLPH